MKTIIAGGRDFDDALYLCECLQNHDEITEVVSGTAFGADTLGANWANELDIPVKEFPADWKKHGKAAGPIRNGEMAEYGDQLIVFYDGRSRGTGNMINQMKNLNKPVKIYKY